MYDRELFEIEYGTNGHLRHVRSRSGRGKPVGVCLFARLRGGGTRRPMSLDEVDAVRRDQRARPAGVWTTVARKTVVSAARRYCRSQPTSREAIGDDEREFRGRAT